MNPTTCLLVKISILVALSCQVLASEHFGGGELRSKLEALHGPTRKLRRRQVELAGANDAATKTDPAKAAAAATDTKTEIKADPKADAKGDVTLKSDAGKDGDKKEQNGSKEEQLATKLFEGIIEMGIGLEAVTNLGSSTKEILDESKKVTQVVPKLKTLTTDLLAAVPKKSDELSKSVEESNQAGEAITKSLAVIEAKVDDANTIKSEYKNLEKSFIQILSASDGVAVAAIPKLAELAKQQQGAGNPRGKADDGKTAGDVQAKAGQPAVAEVALEKKDEGKKAAEEQDAAAQKALAEKKAEDAKAPVEQKPAEQKPAEQKPAELKTEDKPPAATAAEPKAPEPIDTGVVVPGQ
ncbi:uncharacterized protein PGTG_17020 [Puccinia graminis f. sp. tritici CRL 75-36-700-3]|uniref:Cell wall mannoprotein 1 n=1 Tax=Puccinia graminis f. sp. tritici (strain CRL 75-36-700-3 / race SCCL) TaxID=418459 RepID=E3L491_PUCGT|nr:uncharacterized protein PGTG_17020 [Puccinia graminis f. sp. tritici CRL 75-36-700-3]EFP91366.1 hypothetical protein PGTG_17020 [Puccinia graminis f. sp. tritici CRL 75-36-700-3]